MGNTLSRADFLRGRFRPKDSNTELPAYSLLPDAVPVALFEVLCNGCGDCISQCPSHIISLTQSPQGEKACLDFSGGTDGCLFCGQCSEACSTGALDRENAHPWHMKAELNMVSCLSLNGIVCRTCGDVCEPRSLTFRLLTGGRAYPEIRVESCTGCGACVALCPVQAMTLHEMLPPSPLHSNTQSEAET